MLKTKIEIIEETANAYNRFTRARDADSSCVIKSSETGYMCAFGRCFINPDEFLDTIGPALGAIDAPLDDYIMDRLKPEYQHNDRHFWQAIQSLHDTDRNWDAKGLSLTGESEVRELKEKYAGQ